MEQPPKKAPSIGERGKAVARRVTAPITSATNSVTGKNVEQQVAEYTETFTQVALGIHEDLTSALRRIDELEMKTVSVSGDVQPDARPIQKERSIYLLSGIALMVALVALGVALWAAL